MKKGAFRRAVAVTFASAFVFAGITCTDQSTAPKRYAAVVGFAPSFRSDAAEIVGVLASLSLGLDNVHVVLQHDDGTPAADTIVNFGAGADSVVLDIHVDLHANTEILDADIDIRSGTTVLFSGSQKITAQAGASPTDKPADVPMDYSGPGATAATLAVTPKDQIVRSVDSLTFAAAAKTSAGADVPNLLVDWSVKDAAIGSVTAGGKFKAANANVRGFTYVIGRLPTGIIDSARVIVTPVPASLTALPTSSAAVVGTPLLQPVVAVVKAADSLGVPGVVVSFAATLGGGSVSPTSAVTDANGRASTSFTLGVIAGANEVTMSSTGLTSAKVTATGIAVQAANLKVQTGLPATVASGAQFAQQPVIRVIDAHGNLVTTFTGAVTASASAGYTLVGTSTVSAVAGVATFTNLGIAGSAGAAMVGFASGALGKDSASTNVIAGAVGALTTVSGGAVSDTIDAVLTGASVPTLVVRDAQNNPVPGATVKFMRLGHAGGAINGATDTATVATAANGQAAAPMRKLPPFVGFDTVIAQVVGLPDTLRFVAGVVAGKTTHMTLLSNPTGSFIANTTFGAAVNFRDRLENISPVAAGTRSATIALKPATGDPTATLSVGGTTVSLTQDGSNGTASWFLTLNKPAIGFQLVVTSAGLPSVETSAFTITGGSPTGMTSLTTLVQFDTIDAVVTHVDSVPTVIVRDANNLPSPGVAVNFCKHAGPNSALNGQATGVACVIVTTGSDGRAALTSWRMRTGWGVDSVVASASGLTDVTFTALVLSGKPTHIQFIAQPPATTPANTPFGVGIVLRDRLDSVATNITAGSVNAVMAIKPGTGNPGALSPISPTLSLTQDAAAGAAAWIVAINQTATGYKLQVTAGALTAESNAFDVGAGAPNWINVNSSLSPVDSIDAAAAPVSVTVYDVNDEPVPGVFVKFKRLGGNNGGLVSGAIDTISAPTNGSGVASVTRRASSLVGPDTIVVSIGSLADTIVGSVTNGNAHHMVFTAQPSGPLTAGANFASAVTVLDRLSNPAKTLDGTNVAIGITSGSICTNLLPTLNTTAGLVNGVASFTVHVNGAGSCKLTASYVGVPTLDSDPFNVVAGALGSLNQFNGGQGALKGATLPDSIVFVMKDAYGNGIPGLTPTFSLHPSGGGSISGPATTDANGHIAKQWTVGISGPQQLSIDVSGSGTTANAYIAETLKVVQQPVPTQSGIAFTTQPIVRLEDYSHNQVKLAGVNIQAVIQHAGVSCDGVLGMTGSDTKTTDANGEATWTDLAATGCFGMGWKLQFQQAGGTTIIDPTYSSNFSIQPGPAAMLEFFVQPPFGEPGQPFQVVVQAKDVSGHVATSFTGVVTLALDNNPGSSTLSGTTYINAVAGVATFPDVSLNNLGNGYTLTASSAPLDQITSTSFSIVNPVAFSMIAPAVYSNDHYHTCGLTTTGSSYCWGDNTYGAIGAAPNIGGDCVIGYPSTEYCPHPMSVSGATGLTSLSSGDGFTCGLNSSSQAICWGSNGNGELGIGSGNYPSGPVLSANSMTLTQIIAGSYHACGIQAITHLAYCWGYNGYMNLGNSLTDFSAQYLPVAVLGLHTFDKLAANYGNTCGITTSSSIYCWGLNDAKQLGDTLSLNSESSGEPVKVSSDKTFTELAVGASHVCAIDDNGDVYCWGRNAEGQLGDGSNTNRDRPTLASNSSMVKITAGYDHSCSLRSNGVAYCWGANDYGQLGDGTYDAKNTPTQVAGGLTWLWIAAGVQYTCGVTTGHVAYCWGSNGRAELGTGDFSNFNVPTKVGLPGAAGPPP